MPYKKPSEFTERDKQIVKCLNQVKWSSTCDTLETFLDTYGLDLKDIEFKVTSDNEWASRKCRSHLRIKYLRNAGGGGSFKTSLYVHCKYKCDSCVSKITCSLKTGE
jgi:hypothetical protein